jgi:5-methylcytosine-specific restriction endonuclease McrA
MVDLKVKYTQMLFDDSEEGVRNHLLFEEGAKTLLFGFYQTNAGYVIAAYDPERHRDYAYSSSLQVKEWAIQAALATGIVFYPRKSDEIAVVFHVDEIADYLDRAGEFHNLNPAEISEILEQEAPSPVIRQAFSRILDASQLPVLETQERKRRVSEVARFVRSREFKRAIESVYERCAICGFQYDYVLDAAHIVPVSEGGEDTYANGLGLCPNCHRMFDKGLVLVDETGRIHIHPQRAEEYAAIGRAGSLEELQQTLRKTLWLPEDQRYHPSPENLRRVFDAPRLVRIDIRGQYN